MGAYRPRQSSADRATCPPDHDHGLTGTCYSWHHCGCAECRRAHAYQVQRRRLAIKRGDYTGGRRVSCAPVIEHLHYLRAHGMGIATIADAAGVGRTTVNHMFHRTRPPKFCKQYIADAILAVRPSLDLLPGGAFIPPRGVQRRLQALYAVGWTCLQIAEEWGKAKQEVSRLLRDDVIVVTADTHRSIAALYERIAFKQPPESVARGRSLRRAAAGRWVVPMAWDDIDNDPRPVRVERVSRLEFVDELVVELACKGHRPRRLSHAEIRLVITELHSRQFGDPLIAERAGISDREVVRIRKHELGLPAVAYGVSVHRRVA